MAPNEPLGIYLNDHLAGSAAGAELAAKLRDNKKGTELGKLMAALHHDISQDKDALEELMRHLEVERHPVKEAAGWMLEKLSRLRLNPALTGGAELTRLLETEALSLGIEGKLAMWLGLNDADPPAPPRPPPRAGPGPAAPPGAAPAGRGGAVILHLSRTRPAARQHPPAREPDRAPARPRPYRNRTGGGRDDEEATPEPAAGRGGGRRAAGSPAGPGPRGPGRGRGAGAAGRGPRWGRRRGPRCCWEPSRPWPAGAGSGPGARCSWPEPPPWPAGTT